VVVHLVQPELIAAFAISPGALKGIMYPPILLYYSNTDTM
jgi:hypothetical protein